MNCEKWQEQLVLFLHGELSFDEEEALEKHLASCPECAAERRRLEEVFSLLEQGEAEAPSGLLARCRRDLIAAVEDERSSLKRRFSVAELWRRWVVNPPMWLRPVGAFAMLAVGFFAARYLPASDPLIQFAGPNVNPAVVSRVRLVDQEGPGRVRVLFDETRQREISGAMDDGRIRQLLLAAAADQGDPGIRVESIGMLKNQCSDEEVRKALLNAVKNDTNSGVRLKALDGLKPYASDPETRKVLAQVLLTDSNPGVRTQVIDLLVQSKSTDVAGVLQELMRREDNTYVRSRSQKALTEMKASVGTF
jgi:hypothetical protein